MPDARQGAAQWLPALTKGNTVSHNVLRSWMKKLGEKLIGNKPRPVRRPRGKKLRLQAEQLEDRTLLTTWTVTDPNGNAGSGSLDRCDAPYAVSHALSGDTIALPNGFGTITLNATLTLTQSISIDGNASWATFISGNNSVQLFHVNAGVTATLYALTIENGLATNGAGVYNAGNLTLSDDAITGCGSASNTTNQVWCRRLQRRHIAPS